MPSEWLCIFPVFLLVGVVAPAVFGCLRTAIFEHVEQSHANSSHTPENIVEENLKYYAKAVLFARSKGVQIIVFPEYGIFPPIKDRKAQRRYLENVPDPKVTTSIPCLHPGKYQKDRPILYTLSCLARHTNLIIVVNMGDIQPCEGEKGCPADGFYQFNTNVVFDEEGMILAKYHKEHLFEEPAMDLPPPGQDPTFETRLGRFATFVCFDIVFARMAEVSRWKNITAVFIPTMWVNSGPLSGALQYHESWAIGNNVTLLVANIHLPGVATLGSVIAEGRKGAVVFSFNPDGHSKLLVANLNLNEGYKDLESSMYILKKEGFEKWTDDGRDVETVCLQKVLKPAKDIYKEYRCLEEDMTNFTLQRLAAPKGSLRACNGGMCCTLEYEADEILGDYYFGVFNGTYDVFNKNFFAEEDCFLARCDGLNNNESCATFPMRSKTMFRRVHMRANFSTDFIYPSVMESGMRLTPKNQWEFEKMERTAMISLDDTSGKLLLAVGLKARPYSRDSPYVK